MVVCCSAWAFFEPSASISAATKPSSHRPEMAFNSAMPAFRSGAVGALRSPLPIQGEVRNKLYVHTSMIVPPTDTEEEAPSARWCVKKRLPDKIGESAIYSHTDLVGGTAAANREGLYLDLPCVLKFWFGPEYFDDPEQLDSEAYLKSRTKIWYMGGPAIDIQAMKFLPLLRRERQRVAQYGPASVLIPRHEWIKRAGDGSTSSWETIAFAQVVLFDQISRNAARGTIEAFAQDDLASETAKALVDSGFAKRCRAATLLFIAQPLAHAEDPSHVELAIDLLRSALPRFSEPVAKRLSRSIASHEEHLLIVRRFGRYPHRNAVLNRATTSQEQAWLDSDDCPGWARSQM